MEKEDSLVTLRRSLTAARIVVRFAVLLADCCWQVALRVGGIVIVWHIALVVVALVENVQRK